MNRGEAAVRQLDKDGLITVVEPHLAWQCTVFFDMKNLELAGVSDAQLSPTDQMDHLVTLIDEAYSDLADVEVLGLVDPNNDEAGYVTVTSRDHSVVTDFRDDHDSDAHVVRVVTP